MLGEKNFIPYFSVEFNAIQIYFTDGFVVYGDKVNDFFLSVLYSLQSIVLKHLRGNHRFFNIFLRILLF